MNTIKNTTTSHADSITAVIDRTYPLREAAAAVAHMLGHHARGKVAIAA